MKKLSLLVFMLTSTFLHAQESNEKQNSLNSIFEVNYNLTGFGISYEHVLANKFTLKGEFSYQGNINFKPDDFEFILAPSLSAEARYYYNLENRITKGKNTKNNSGNFLSLKAQYFADFANISNKNNQYVYNQFYIAPMWNISRNFGNSNFGYELGIGAGISYVYKEHHTKSEFIIPFNLKISYKL